MLPSREAAPLTAWIRDHPGVKIVCRDRLSAYTDGVRTAAPEAIQVADRFHLMRDLSAAVEHCVASHKTCLRDGDDPPAVEPRPAVSGTPSPEPTGLPAERRREHHTLVLELIGQGMGIRQITLHLGWGRHIVRRYARAATSQQLVVGGDSPAISLDPYKPYLLVGYTGWHCNVQALHREITV